MNEYEKNKTEADEKVQFSTTFFKGSSEEPKLWEYDGIDDSETSWVYAKTCNRVKDCGCKLFFSRLDFIQRITQMGKPIRGGKK